MSRFAIQPPVPLPPDHIPRLGSGLPTTSAT